MASVRKRGTKWVVNYTDQSGRRRLKTFERKKEADAYRLKIEVEIERGIHIPASESLSVAEICDRVLIDGEDRVRTGQLSPGRLRTIGNHVNRHIVPHLGGETMNEITFMQIDAWLKILLRKSGLKITTCKFIYETLKSIEQFAKVRGLVTKTPIKDASRLFQNIERQRIDTFSVDEIKHLLAVADTCDSGRRRRAFELTRCVVNIAAFCGLRYGEIMALKPENVDLDMGVIKVRHSLDYPFLLKGPKTKAGIRDVPMPSHLGELIRNWQKNYFIDNPLGVLFTALTGRPIRNPCFHISYWKPLQRRAGFEKNRHFHALRHFASSFMIDNNMPLTEVSSLMGHSKFDVTLQVYAHPLVSGNRRRSAIQSMADKLVSGPPAGLGATVARLEGLST